MSSKCENCSELLSSKAEWCPQCYVITPGTISPIWALVFGIAFAAPSIYFINEIAHEFNPKDLIGLGITLPWAAKYLATSYRLYSRKRKR